MDPTSPPLHGSRLAITQVGDGHGHGQGHDHDPQAVIADALLNETILTTMERMPAQGLLRLIDHDTKKLLQGH
jgi:hypothetical protein